MGLVAAFGAPLLGGGLGGALGLAAGGLGPQRGEPAQLARLGDLLRGDLFVSVAYALFQCGEQLLGLGYFLLGLLDLGRLLGPVGGRGRGGHAAL
ncbi:hypothetical protein [Streptomyces natalensis]|uniref:Uncharacterized protein n=1 Tax=Streptomyces natalensis ATCC 27448 TaxID=1240678 RepID=A0A0D7CFK2_9ACTN|nr:hypothetical protein [Streptomyces natalensis]KIZ15049.1 hypothetical protein SNA_29450 [Streptomyces natalensis ATCC 27448]